MVFVAVLGLVVLMIVHELGHYLAARRFGMRVTKFSIGFGPALWKYQPKGSPTTYQIGIIPFLAYVQVAGMNPYEEIDPNDKGSYANASLWARIVTIFAGSLANYLFASVFFFFGLVADGKPVATTYLNVKTDGPAAQSGIVSGDHLIAINDQPIAKWDEVVGAIAKGADKELNITIERGSEKLHKFPKPLADGKDKGKILIGPQIRREKISLREASVLSLKAPFLVVTEYVTGIGQWIRGKVKLEFGGAPRLVGELADAAREGLGTYLGALGTISAMLAAFNLFPLPALDGGRLIFLAFEAISRRRPNAKAEALVHAVGLLVFLGLMAVVIVVSDIPYFMKK